MRNGVMVEQIEVGEVGLEAVTRPLDRPQKVETTFLLLLVIALGMTKQSAPNVELPAVP